MDFKPRLWRKLLHFYICQRFRNEDSQLIDLLLRDRFRVDNPLGLAEVGITHQPANAIKTKHQVLVNIRASFCVEDQGMLGPLRHSWITSIAFLTNLATGLGRVRSKVNVAVLVHDIPPELTDDRDILVAQILLTLDLHDAFPIRKLTSEALEQDAIVSGVELDGPGVFLVANLASNIDTFAEAAVGFARSAEQRDFGNASLQKYLSL